MNSNNSTDSRLEKARAAARRGAVAAFVSAGITALAMAYSITFDGQGELAVFNDPWIAIDVVLLVLFGIGMLRYSRVAACLVSIYWILAKALIAMETGQIGGSIMGFLFLVFFLSAIWGTFTYHKIRKSEDPDYKASGRWAVYASVPVIVILLSLFALGLMIETGNAPSTEVIAGAEVTEANLDLLRESSVLFEDENVEFFYSYGFLSILAGGSILTDRAVITYFPDENDNLQVYELKFADILSVEREVEGDWSQDAVYTVIGIEPETWIVLELSAENGGDVRFIEALEEKVRLTKKASDNVTI